jgi:fructokinase
LGLWTPASPTFSFIKKTPKTGWSNVDVVGAIKDAVHLPVVIESDINAAVFGGYVFGAGRGFNNIVYLNVGTGIGAGAIVNGTIVRATEMGYMRIPHDWTTDPFRGSCIFHGDCLEGLASGVALRERWKFPAEDIPTDHPAWALEAEYLSAGVVNVVSVLSPQRVIVGGGVTQQPHLLCLVRSNVLQQLGGYLESVESEEAMQEYIVKPGLLEKSGVMGAFAMARAEVENGSARMSERRKS